MSQAPFPPITAPRIAALRRQRLRGWRRAVLGLAIAVAALVALTLMLGQSFTPPAEVWRVLSGQDAPGAAFVVGQLRLPRAALALLAGASFGMAGAAFQILLRNPLASPDIIGISSGASAAAVLGIVVLGLEGAALSLMAVLAGLGVAVLIYGLSFRGGIAGTRLILVGIGISAMLDSVIAYVLARAPSWDLQEAMRWLTGSVNGARLDQALPLAVTLILCGGLILSRARDLETLRLGEDTAAALGVRVGRARATVILAAVALIAVATAVTGPIAFVAFLSGPIAARMTGPRGSALLPAALVGALLVLVGDYAGQFLLPARYPVGVVTGALGAPYLILLIIRANRIGAT
ncbi:FecCD family ABC transporter permease [Paracoccus gahaiensis]|uniref:FecCD family ABC transporter permease n=1 Tax=Paracoccus gahaiensis TaxID=1706839 RepID=UPI001FEBBBB6|nr:iron ABC transporter permease [Paracoccus gahaiensis]